MCAFNRDVKIKIFLGLNKSFGYLGTNLCIRVKHNIGNIMRTVKNVVVNITVTLTFMMTLYSDVDLYGDIKLYYETCSSLL